jgi:hypothetical protein
MMRSADDRLETLATMSPALVASEWAKLTKSPLPNISADLLRLAVAYEIQSKSTGGLSSRAQQRLNQIAAGKTETQQLAPGTRLAREWNGVVQIVAVDDRGAITWNGREWRSLSEVARAITGTRWSGPAFFGLQRRKAA